MLSMTSQTTGHFSESVLPLWLPSGQAPANRLPTKFLSSLAQASFRGSARTLKAGESLFLQGDRVDAVYILQEGWAFCYQALEDGRRQIIDFALPGDIVSFAQVALTSYGIESLTACRFIKFSKSELDAGLKREPRLAAKLIESVCASQVRAFNHLTNVGRRGAKERVAYLLLELVQRLTGKQSSIGCSQFELPLAQAHFADALGLTGETVCRSLTELKNKRILILLRGTLSLLDFDALAEEAAVVADDYSWETPASKTVSMRP